MSEKQILQTVEDNSERIRLRETKQAYRKFVWDELMKNKVACFPKPYGRIPNFKGAAQAAAKLLELDEFNSSKSVEVNPDKPLEFSRILVLENGKELYVPIPRLQESLLKKLTIEEGLDIKKIVSRWGIENTGNKIDINDKLHIDLFVLGSVAVSKQGHRIGKGKGYADLEYAILKEMNAINENTVIVTTVHDLQVFDVLPQELFRKHDVPIDYILTPTQVIKIEKTQPKPEGIYWELLSERQLNNIEVLRKLKRHEQKDSLDLKNKLQHKAHKNSRASRFEEVNSIQPVSSENNENVPPRRYGRGSRNFNIDFSLLVRNIEKNVRVRDLKNALVEKGVKPYSITWKGHRGFCYLHYATKNNKTDNNRKEPFAIDNVIEILQGLQLTPDSKRNLEIIVMEPITRIETTDVTAV